MKCLLLSTCHAERLADHRTPVGSVRSLSAQMPEGFARRSQMRPLRFRSRANPVDDFASRVGEVPLGTPPLLRASPSHSRSLATR